MLKKCKGFIITDIDKYIDYTFRYFVFWKEEYYVINENNY